MSTYGPRSLCAGFAAAACLLLGFNALADETYTARSVVTGLGTQKITSFDISYVDPVIGLYLLADRTNKSVDVVDTIDNNKLLFQLQDGFAGVQPSNDNAGPNGVMTVNHREVWAGDAPSMVKVIDLFTQQPTVTIGTGGSKRADEMCFDPRDQIAVVANDAESPYPWINVIAATTYSKLQQITMDGSTPLGSKIATPKATNGIEQCQWDHRTGKFYVNIPENNGPGNDTQPGAVVVLSVQSDGTLSIDNVLSVPLSQCAGPQGMTVGPDHQILLGCNNPNGANPALSVPYTIIIDDRVKKNDTEVKVIAKILNQDGSDEVWFNEGDNSYFLGRSGGQTGLTQFQQLGIIDAGDGEPIGSDQSVNIGLPNTTASPHGTAHSVAADPIFNQIYVPIPSTATSPGGPTICSSAGGTDANGCIAVFTSRGSDDPETASR